MNIRKSVDHVIFDFVLLAVFIAFIIIGAGYQPMARQLPLPISIIGGLFIFVLVLSDLFPVVERVIPLVGRQGIGGQVRETQTDANGDGNTESMSPKAWLRLLRIVCWLIVLIVAMKYISYLLATGCFVFLLTWVEGRVTWWKSLISAVGTVVFFYIVFNLFLHVAF
ncbi:tripartite tricarboxylate transporter TctB family protein [Alicyclobacillus fastidiosus]|uniref:Tripartite tricarboxylate transporter TctB family protein n=1 Tax=Alicyclobacillus fastidiosus TaxID=392011 RepID=A0ABV5AA69_9BACL|nr:tripartite tricarboxylate transporter TctB family protein [Alicyclobacillus fastidiosus]WEH07695.1 tripartite tricarboxylate transporter TctB family protein [Alicyclobacillus fastidiosus]